MPTRGTGQPAKRDLELSLDQVLERITDAFIAVDGSWRITYCNAAAARLARRPAASLVDRILWEEYPDLLGTVFETNYRRAMAEQVPVSFEFEYPPLDLWVAITAYPSPTGLSVYSRDISAQKRAQLQLAQSEARYRLIAETANEGMWLVDAEYRTMWVNRRLAELLGYAPEQLLGRRVPEFVLDEDLPELRRRMAERQQGKADSYDIRMRRSDGRVVWVLAAVAPVIAENGAFAGALGMLTDISDRKRFEAELQAQKEWFHVTLSSIGDAVIATDAQGRVTFMNAVAESLTGWSRSDAAGLPLHEVFRIFNEQSRLPVESPVARALREGTVVGLANHTILISRDGTERPIDDSGAPIRDAGGRIIGVVLVFRDNSQRAEVERALREADRRKDEFLAVLGHELRNPLAPIANALQIMRLRPHEEEVVVRARDVIGRQVEQMTRLVDDLLDIARVTRDSISLRMTRADVEGLVARAVETMRPQLAARGQQLRVESGEPLVVEVDVARIAQVVSNLLHNASKFSPEGGEIVLAWAREGAQVCLKVSDQGRGIPPDKLEAIFKPFMQADPSSDRAQGGLGLGLSLVQKLVDLHGGRVEARSDGPGRGSEFCIRLPLAENEATAAESAEEPADPVAPLRVLLVDDNRDAAETLASVLGSLGHRVTVAHDADEALARMRQDPPEVAILDIGLPRTSGYELARIVRRELGAAGPTLIALSGYGQEQDRQRAVDAGFDHYMVKPADLHALQEALASLRK